MDAIWAPPAIYKSEQPPHTDLPALLPGGAASDSETIEVLITTFMLEVTGLCRVLEERTLFQDVSFSLRRAEVLFISGPSGVGKSLLLRTISCLDEAQVRACVRSIVRGRRVLHAARSIGAAWVLALSVADPHACTQGGTISLDGESPSQWGYPVWRANVCYVPQGRVNFPGTPTEFYFQVCSQRMCAG
jgi:ABC-type iron transport system FetAB ATPase subunit